MTDNLLHIEGTVENVVFKKEDSGYVVFDINSGGEMITVVGNLGDIEKGETLRLSGTYMNHVKFGTQFRAEYCERKLPDKSVDIEKYLASGVIKGIGAGLARKIVNVFGDDTLNIIENKPNRLVEVKGISPKKCSEITEEAKKLFSLRLLTSFLSSYDIKPLYAIKCYKKYGSDSLETVRKNPYILCSVGIELDFRKADFLAEKLDISKNDDFRIIEGIKYILSANVLNGHSCLPLEKLKKITLNLLGISESDFFKSYNLAADNEEIGVYLKNNKEYVYLPEYLQAEKYISDYIHSVADLPLCEEYDYEQLISDEEKESNIKYAEKQRLAIKTAISRHVMVLTGTAGTGKTTTLNAIISILEKKEKNVILAAPTGRAAKRMSELTSHSAKTIHRLLEVTYSSDDKPVFLHNEKNPLKCGTIIIDEMSMVDVLLFESLLRALPKSCRIIMTGDFHQLPSVAAGSLLEDIIKSYAVPVVELTKVFRQAQESCIIMNANKIIEGEYPDLSKKDNDFFFFKRNQFENVVSLISELVSERLPKTYDYSPFDDIQVITPAHKGTVGTDELNITLQKILNPPSRKKAEYKIFNRVLRTGDKVMQMKNNYDIVWKKDDEQGTGIFNGDIGRIVNINKIMQVAEIDFDGRVATYPFDTLEQIELAYAITVHKSQGCEFEVVIMPVMSGFDKLCYRNLLYTAVTRAKKLIILIGSEEKIRNMVDNNKKTKRYTCLCDMLERKETKNG